MPLLYEARKTTRESNERVVWMVVIVLGLILVAGVILFASIDDFSWILS
jgi:hypothetical protein